MKVATVNYRLTKKDGLTTVESVTDCKDAIRFFAANAKRFGVDPKRFILMGGSADGHLTLMTALAPDADYPPKDSSLNEALPPACRRSSLLSASAIFAEIPLSCREPPTEIQDDSPICLVDL